MLAALLVLALLVPPTTAAGAERREPSVEASDGLVSVQLPLTSAAGVLGGDDEIYVTGDDELLVYDLDGEQIGQIDDLPGAGPMALDPEGELLFIGLTATVPPQIVVIDLEDLVPLDIAWEVPARPRRLAAGDDTLQVAVGAPGQAGNIPALVTIAADPDVAPVVRGTIGTPLPVIAGDALLVAHAGSSPGSVERRQADGAATNPPSVRQIGGFLRDLDHDDVGRFWVAGSGQQGPSLSVHALDPASLATMASVPVGGHPRAVRVLGSGAHVAAGHGAVAGRDLTIMDVTASAPRITARYEIPGDVIEAGMSVATDGTLAVLSSQHAPARRWLTLVDQPTLTLAELEVDADAVIDEEVALAARLLEPDGTPIPNARLVVAGPDGTSTATTDALGHAVLRHPPLPAAGLLQLAVDVAGIPTHRPVQFTVDVHVRKRDVAVTADDLPSGVRVGEPVLVSGTVRDGGPLAGHPVRVSVTTQPALTTTVLTDTQGRFDHTIPGLGWATHQVRVQPLETERHAPATVARTLAVRRWKPRIELTASTITATVPTALGGRLLTEDGAPIAGAAITVQVLDAEVTTTTVTTNAVGAFAVPHTAPAGGTLTLLATRAADVRDEAASAGTTVTIARAAQQLVVDAPPAATALRPVTITGTLTDHRGGAIVGAGLDLRVRNGSTLLRTPATTGAGGRWSAIVTPARHGTWTVEVSHPGDLVKAPAAAQRSLVVAPAPAALTMDALPTPVPWGRPLAVKARLPAPSRAPVQLWARDEASGTWKRLADATTDTAGLATFPVTARATTRYEVRFAGDATYSKASAARVVRVSSVVEAAVSGHDRLVSGEPSFARGARPTVSGRVRAARLPGSVTVTLQRWDGARWVAAQRWTAVAADGRVVTRVPKGLGAGRHRVQIAAPATPTNLAATSPWRPLRVR